MMISMAPSLPDLGHGSTIEEILREFSPHLISIVFFMGPLKIAKNIK
jgi:hypothetical protein